MKACDFTFIFGKNAIIIGLKIFGRAIFGPFIIFRN